MNHTDFFDDNIAARCWQSGSTLPETIERIQMLQPRVVVFEKEVGDYKILRHALTSWTGNDKTGRVLRSLVIDDCSGKWLGQLLITSDTPANKLRDAKYTYDYNTWANLWGCVPVYQFGQCLGGKLLTIMATSQELRDLWHAKYGQEMKYMSILSIHGRPSQYDGLSFVQALGTSPTGKGVYLIDYSKEINTAAEIAKWREKSIKYCAKKKQSCIAQ